MTDLRNRPTATADQLAVEPPIIPANGAHLGQLLRRLRHDAGMTPEGLANRLAMSRSGVLRREQIGFLPADALITHARALGHRVALIRDDALTPDRRPA